MKGQNHVFMLKIENVPFSWISVFNLNHYLINVIKAPLFTNCRRFKCLSLNNRSTVRNSILAKSHWNSLIDQRCRLSIIAKCVSLSHAVCGCWSMLSSVSISTRTQTHTLSLSLRYLAFFPHLFFPFINLLCDCVCINWNKDLTVLGCSHFKGNTNTK